MWILMLFNPFAVLIGLWYLIAFTVMVFIPHTCVFMAFVLLLMLFSLILHQI